MTRYMLDTNTVSYLMRGHDAVQKAVFSKDYADLCISCMTQAALLHGLNRRPEASQRARMIHEFLDRVEALPWGSKEAACYGRLRAGMERSGKSLQPRRHAHRRPRFRHRCRPGDVRHGLSPRSGPCSRGLAVKFLPAGPGTTVSVSRI